MKDIEECEFCGCIVEIEKTQTCDDCGNVFCDSCIKESETGEYVCYNCLDM